MKDKNIRESGASLFQKLLLFVHYSHAKKIGLSFDIPKNYELNENELYHLLQYSEIISHNKDDQSRIKAVTIVALLADSFKENLISNSDFLSILKKVSTNILINLGLSVTAKMLGEKKDAYYSTDNTLNDLILGNDLRGNTIKLKNLEFTLSKFQKRVWDGINEFDKVAISAPTSAGKSFALNLKIIHLMLSSENLTSTIYIVPTISLINQVCSDLKSILKKNSVDNVKVLQAVSEKFRNENAIYVLTQERALTAINNHKWLKDQLKFLVVDEIQNIEKVSNESEERSLILLEVLNSINEEFLLKKIILAGARIKNIEEFNRKFLGQNSYTISDELPTVINLTYSFSRKKSARIKPIIFSQKVTSLNEAETIINVDDSFHFSDKIFKKSEYNEFFEELILKIIDNDPHNIIFSSSSKRATNNALEIKENLKYQKDVQDLDGYLRKTIHKDYPLANCVVKGVGYHHGKLPAHVRHVVEICFKEGLIDNLFCTTTLMQGVNLPAKNIIVWNPKIGTNNTLSGYDYTNLRGRAGRLMNDFVGRAIVLDKKAFEDIDIEVNDDVEKNINLSFKSKYQNNKESIDELLKMKKPVDSSNQEANEIVIYVRSLFVRLTRDKALKRIENLGISLPERSIKECEKISLALPNLVKEVSIQLPQLDPLFLNAIYEKIIKDEWIAPPNSAYDSNLTYLLVFQLELIFETSPYYFKKAFNIKELKQFDDFRGRIISLCIYASQWVRDIPISKVINPINYPVLEVNDIDNRLKDISNMICFEIPKLLKPAFMIWDLFYFQEFKNPLLTFLEFGASGANLRALIDYGLPRETSINLLEIKEPNFITNDKISVNRLEKYLLEGLKNKNLHYWDKRIIQRVL